MSMIQILKEQFAEEELNKKVSQAKEEFEKLKEDLSKENEELRHNLNELQNIVSKKG